MFSDLNNDSLAYMVKSNPEFETIIQNIIDENKRTTSMFVHELRNPLSLLKGTIQYIELKNPETKEYKYWNQLHDLINDLEHMMADASLLNTCNNLNKSEVDLASLITQIVNGFMPQAISQNTDLRINIEPGCASFFASYFCDAFKFKQVFSNLIKNALEATTPNNFIHIDLGFLEGIGEIPSKLSIKISNNGLPIPPEEIENIFVPFVTYKKGGTGVGLAIVKKIINLHYGSIQVESDESLTCFTIHLPI